MEKLLNIVRKETEAHEREWEEYYRKEHRPPKKKRKLFDFFDLFD